MNHTSTAADGDTDHQPDTVDCHQQPQQQQEKHLQKTIVVADNDNDDVNDDKQSMTNDCKVDITNGITVNDNDNNNDKIEINIETIELEKINDNNENMLTNLNMECEKIETLLQTLNRIELESLPSSLTSSLSITNDDNNELNDLNVESINDDENVNQIIENDEKINDDHHDDRIINDNDHNDDNDSKNKMNHLENISNDDVKDGKISEISNDKAYKSNYIEIPKPRERKSKSVDHKSDDQNDSMIKKDSEAPIEDGAKESSDTEQNSVSNDPKVEHEDKASSESKPIAIEKTVATAVATPVIKIEKPKDYPEDLNPFGDEDDDDDGGGAGGATTTSKVTDHQPNPMPSTTVIITKNESNQSYPQDLNPFGDDDDDDDQSSIHNHTNNSIKQNMSSSLNPFGSEDEDDDSSLRIIDNKSPIKQQQHQSSSTPVKQSSPTPLSKRKKRPAPLPPSINKSNQSLDKISNSHDKSITNDHYHHQQDSISSISNMESLNLNEDSISSSNVSFDSLQMVSNDSDKANRVPTPLPRRSKQQQQPKNQEEIKSSDTIQQKLAKIKSKKRPAPPRPAFKRELKASTSEMDAELNSIADKLPLIEKEKLELEQWLLLHLEKNDKQIENANGKDDHRASDETNGKEYDAKLAKFLELAKEKCKLGRKQKELMYMKREIKLEETQLDIEYQLRVIMSKQDAQKTAEDRDNEQHLLQQMMELIDERNDIIENMIQDENKEIEEYQNMINKVIPKQSNADNSQAVNGNNHSKKQPLKPFRKLKKLNKKIKNKFDKLNHSSNNDNNNNKQNGHVNNGKNDENDNKIDDDDDNESYGSMTSGNSSLQTSTNDLSTTNNDNSFETTNLAKKSNNNQLPKSNSTLKLLTSKSSKTLSLVTNELKSKLKHSNNHNYHEQQQQQPKSQTSSGSSSSNQSLNKSSQSLNQQK